MPEKGSFADWARDHAIAVDSLDSEAPFDDLEPLRDLIGNARVVAIGENAHHVREFYLLRHRLFRFLVERCGFTIYALEVPFSGGREIDRWIQGGPGKVADIASANVSFGMGCCRELHDHLAWMRAHNRTVGPALRFAGAGLPDSGGSPLRSLEEVSAYLRRADPDALPLLEEAIALVRTYHDPATFTALSHYANLNSTAQDALTAALRTPIKTGHGSALKQMRAQPNVRKA